MRNMLHLHDREKPMIAELSSAPITGTLTSRARMNQTQRKLKAKFLYHCTFTKSKLNGIYIGDRGGNYFSLRGKHSSACWFPLLRWKSVSVWWHIFWGELKPFIGISKALNGMGKYSLEEHLQRKADQKQNSAVLTMSTLRCFLSPGRLI